MEGANKNKNILREVKSTDLSKSNVTLAVVKEYKKHRISQYTVKYVPIEPKLQKRLRKIVTGRIEKANTMEPYTADCPEPEADLVRSIGYEETDFHQIYSDLSELNPEEDTIDGVDELVKSKAYMIILRNADGIQVVGFKTLPENWKLKKSKDLISLLFEDNRFEDLESQNVFSISNFVDLFYFDEYLFILSKKNFEKGLNFRVGMLDKAQEMFSEVAELNIFANLEILTEKVGTNMRYLRKVATIRNLGHYRDPEFIKRMKQLNELRGWSLTFEADQIALSDDTLDSILSILQNKRLRSEFTEEDFDVESTKAVNMP